MATYCNDALGKLVSLKGTFIKAGVKPSITAKLSNVISKTQSKCNLPVDGGAKWYTPVLGDE